MTASHHGDYAQVPAGYNVRSVCAWHMRNFGFEMVLNEEELIGGVQRFSHGICPECLQILITELRQETR